MTAPHHHHALYSTCCGALPVGLPHETTGGYWVGYCSACSHYGAFIGRMHKKPDPVALWLSQPQAHRAMQLHHLERRHQRRDLLMAVLALALLALTVLLVWGWSTRGQAGQGVGQGRRKVGVVGGGGGVGYGLGAHGPRMPQGGLQGQTLDNSATVAHSPGSRT